MNKQEMLKHIGDQPKHSYERNGRMLVWLINTPESGTVFVCHKLEKAMEMLEDGFDGQATGEALKKVEYIFHKAFDQPHVITVTFDGKNEHTLQQECVV